MAAAPSSVDDASSPAPPAESFAGVASTGPLDASSPPEPDPELPDPELDPDLPPELPDPLEEALPEEAPPDYEPLAPVPLDPPDGGAPVAASEQPPPDPAAARTPTMHVARMRKRMRTSLFRALRPWRRDSS